MNELWIYVIESNINRTMSWRKFCDFRFTNELDYVFVVPLAKLL